MDRHDVSPGGHDDKLHLLEASAWLKVLPSDLRGHILKQLSLRKLSKGFIIWHMGDPVDGLYGLLSGCVRMDTVQSAHGPTMLNLFHAGSWLGEAEILSGTGRITGLIAQRESRSVFIHRATLAAVAGARPEIWRGIGYLATEHLRLAVAGLDDLTIRSSEGRLAAVLLRLCGARLPDIAGSINMRLDVTQAELAQMANLSRSRMGTLMEDVERRSLVRRSYGRVEVAEIAALAEILGSSAQDTS